MSEGVERCRRGVKIFTVAVLVSMSVVVCGPDAGEPPPDPEAPKPPEKPEAPQPPEEPKPPEPEPLPALVVSSSELEASVSVGWVEFEAGACSISDRCVASGGWRRILQADIVVQNSGEAPVVLGDEAEGDYLEPDACRDRDRLRVSPRIELFDGTGKLVRQVRTRSACWYDETPVDAEADAARFDCENPGLGVGWSHRSTDEDDCQLIDVTDLSAGDYRLRVTVDPDRLIAQSDRSGNAAEVAVRIEAAEDDPLCIDDTCYVPQPGACAGVVCDAEPATLVCEDERVVRVEMPGLCHPEEGTCIAHREETEDCAALDLHCDAGACKPPEGLPDLTVSAARLHHSHFVEWAHFEPESCAVAYGCVHAPGWRRLLRFTTVIENRGTAPAHIGAPADNPEWEFDTCRGHYLYQNDTIQALLDQEGHEITRTIKKSFCLYDVHPIPGWPDPPEAQHPASDETCWNNQGITHGWVDVYHHSLVCQWVDVTDVAPGNYVLEVTVNADRFIEELDHDNNTVQAPVEVPPTDGPPEGP